MNEIHKQIGLFLKTKRHKKNLTKEKITKKTNISIQNIINIENGRFNLLHGEFYQKSFIKSYCNALKIDDKKLLALLNQSKDEIIQNKNVVKEEKHESHAYNKMIPSKPLILFASFFLFLFFVINIFYNSIVKNNELANINPKPTLNIEPIKEYNTYQDVQNTDTFKQTNYDSDVTNEVYSTNEFSILKKIIAKEREKVVQEKRHKRFKYLMSIEDDQGNDKPILAITEAQMTGMGSSGLIIGNHNRDIHIGPIFDSSAAVTTTNGKGILIK